MERRSAKRRDIKFFSGKNQTVVCVHSSEVREYTKYLEGLPALERYEADLPLELARFPHLSVVDIRTEYFTLDWVSDFRLFFDDGRAAIREFVKVQNLKKRAIVEQLELSRRYWQAVGIHDWKIVTDNALNVLKEVNDDSIC